MCVEEKDLSAYVDGELTPEREREIAQHLEGCPSCRAKLDSLRGVGVLLSSSEEELDIDGRKRDSWDRISVSVRRNPGPPLWNRHLYLSLPATAAAALLLVLLGGFSAVLAGNFSSPREYRGEALPVVEREEERREAAFHNEKREPTREEMEELIRFLSERGASVEVKIELPKPSNFTIYGEPQLIRAADYAEFKENTGN